MVSRETPAIAEQVFDPERLTLATAYVEWLAGAGVERGLIGPREAPRLWHRHVVNCAVLADVVPARADVADIGSGAGLPGVVLAIARPDLSVTLIEPLARRATFLSEVVDELRLGNVEVLRERAEGVHGRHFDVVTSRAVAPLPRLLGWSMPLVAAEGAMVALKGSSVRDEVEAAAADLRRLKCADPEVLVLGETLAAADPDFSPTHAVRVAHRDPARVALRRSGSGRPPKSRRVGG